MRAFSLLVHVDTWLGLRWAVEDTVLHRVLGSRAASSPAWCPAPLPPGPPWGLVLQPLSTPHHVSLPLGPQPGPPLSFLRCVNYRRQRITLRREERTSQEYSSVDFHHVTTT